jgi:hypothetical protein
MMLRSKVYEGKRRPIKNQTVGGNDGLEVFFFPWLQ